MKTHPKILAALAGRWLDRPGEPRGDEAIEAFARALVAYAEDETLQRLAGPEANEILEQADVEADAALEDHKPLASALFTVLARVGLMQHLRRVLDGRWSPSDGERFLELVFTWLQSLAAEDKTALHQKGRNLLVNPNTPAEDVRGSFAAFIKDKESAMSSNFTFDLARLPERLKGGRQTSEAEAEKNRSSYLEAVHQIAHRYGVPTTRGDDVEIGVGAIVGMLLLDEHFDESAHDFEIQVRRARDELFEGLSGTGDERVSANDLYVRIHERLSESTNGADIFFQEFATIGRDVVEKRKANNFTEGRFDTYVEIGKDGYVSGPPPFASLDLPPLVGQMGGGDEIVPDNIRAVGLLYAGFQLEQLRLFSVVDRIVEMFVNGVLPVGYDAGGKALDTYYWKAEERMDEAQRFMQYSRCLGVAGGDVSREVQPNSEFNGLLMRFIATVAEHERQRQIGDFFEPRRNGAVRPLSASTAQVRKAGRDIAANASLYGWASTQFAARRINQQINDALAILKTPQIQQAFGVGTSWQVIERVTTTELGQAPNIVRHRTLALAGHHILDIIAAHPGVWSSDVFGALVGNGGIADDSWQQLVRESESFLAVNGVNDDAVDQYSEPTQTSAMPSLPTFGGFGGNGQQMLDQITNMTGSGGMPDLGILNPGSNGQPN